MLYHLKAILAHQWVCATNVHTHTNTHSLGCENTLLVEVSSFPQESHSHSSKSVLPFLYALITSFPAIAHNISYLYRVWGQRTLLSWSFKSPQGTMRALYVLRHFRDLWMKMWRRSIFFRGITLLIESVVHVFYLINDQKTFEWVSYNLYNPVK